MCSDFALQESVSCENIVRLVEAVEHPLYYALVMEHLGVSGRVATETRLRLNNQANRVAS